MRRWSGVGMLGLAAVLAGGCGMVGGDFSGGPSGEFGATQGGVQDLTLARSLVEAGRVPPAAAFPAEAMFSEHDLPVQGPPCDTLLCLRGAAGVAPDPAGRSTLWVQIGMSSTIDPETYVRPTQTLVATVDVSGSMGWSYGSAGTPGELSRALLRAVADRLETGDRFAIVTFGSATRIHLPLTDGGDRTTIRRAIDALREDGSTDMESGMRTAFPLAVGALGSTEAVRVMVFSDYQPNVGATTPTEFQRIAAEGAADGVGLTLFGLGTGLGPEVMKAMSELRGGNAFSLTDPDDVQTLMEDSWPWMISPIAYDLEVKLAPVPGYRLAAAFGFPGEAGDTEASLEVASVFLSRRRGAMLVGLQPEDPAAPVAPASVPLLLAYTTPDGEHLGRSVSADYAGEPLDDRGTWFAQEATGRTVALALLVDAMADAAELYADRRPAAVDRLAAAVERFAADAAALRHPDLDRELEFARALLALMEAGAPQGTLYGGY